jgi:ParB family transcriptional regulator, chromosome partitioning protein
MAKKFPDITEQFSSAVQTHSQQKEIDTLKAEIEQLRAKNSPKLETELNRLREQLSSQTNEIDIDINLIDPNVDQPRRTITDAEIQKKVRFLVQQGQTIPIILIPKENGRYLIFDGEVRWHAAKFKLGWERIKAVLIPMPLDLHRSALETFLGFEDLNPLDKAEAIFQQVAKDTGLNPSQVFTHLNTCLRAIERSGQIKQFAKLLDLQSEEQYSKLNEFGVTDDLIRRLLLSLLHMGLNPASVKTQFLPMLFLPQDLKVSIRQKGLKGAHSLILATLTAKTLKSTEKVAAKERTLATKVVLAEELNVAKTRELVSKVKLKYNPTVSTESKRVASLLKGIDFILEDDELGSASPEQLDELAQKLDKIKVCLDKMRV